MPVSPTARAKQLAENVSSWAGFHESPSILFGIADRLANVFVRVLRHKSATYKLSYDYNNWLTLGEGLPSGKGSRAERVSGTVDRRLRDWMNSCGPRDTPLSLLNKFSALGNGSW